MKTKFNHLLIFTLFAFISFTACQDEVTDINNPNEQETIVPNSALANLISFTSANFGATDDILDGSSCFSVDLPVTIVVSDVTIIIETEADLEELEDLFNELNDDEDFLNFVFPITIIFSDYTELVIENQDQLEDFINECEDDDDVIECIDFVYPISFSVFNSQFVITDTVVIENDEELYNFLDELEDEENTTIVSLNYPLTLEYASGETIEVNSNEELSDAIESAEDDCDDDEDEYCDDESIELALKECQWEIAAYSSFPDFQGFKLEFNSDYSFGIILDENQVLNEGNSWSIVTNDNVTYLVLSTDFEDLGGEWLIIECDDDRFEFTKNNETMVLEQECEEDLDCSIADISEILQECPWDFTDAIGSYDNYQLVFNDNGELLITEGSATSAIGGNWSLSVTDEGLVITLSELTAFQNDLGGDWLIIECDDERLVIVRGDYSLILEQDCESDLNCSVPEINANIVECAWLLETNLIDTLVVVYVYFTPNEQVLMSDNNGSGNQVGTWNLTTTGSNIFMDFTFENGFEVLSGQWQIVECSEDELYLVNGNDYITLDQDCDYGNDEEVFNCFGDFEIVECAQPNNVPVYNLNAGSIGLVDCQYPFTASFHATEVDAVSNVNAIENAEAYGTLVAQVYLRIEAESGNFEIFTIYLNTIECNYFECFENREIVVCDDDINDGLVAFDLNQIYANCPNDDTEYTFHITIADAEASMNALVSPFVNTSNPQTIYTRVQLAGNSAVFEIFQVNLIVEDCTNSGCGEEDVDAFLTECIWNAVSYNGSDNLFNWNFDFELNSQIVVIYNDSQTIDATWTTSQSPVGVIIEFTNVAGPNIQAITGEWLVVECEEDRLELHRENDILVLERTCN